MNAIKKYFGVIWMLLGPTILTYLLKEAIHKNSVPGSTSNDLLQWGIIIGIFIPICLGFMLFGYFSFKGEYDFEVKN